MLKFEKFQSKMKKSSLHLHQVFQEGPLVLVYQLDHNNKMKKKESKDIYTYLPISLNDIIQNTIETNEKYQRKQLH